MAIIRVRLDDEDRKRYGGDTPLPEDLALDTEWLKDLPASELDEIERETDVFLVALLPALDAGSVPKASVLRRTVAFLAVRQAGHRVASKDFQPRLLRAEFTVEEGEGRPPAGPSAASSED